MEFSAFKKVRAIFPRYKNILIAGLVIVIYAPTFVLLGHKYLAADSYYSHGFLVPVVSVYLIWSKRKRIQSLLPGAQSSLPGLILLIAGLLLHLISTALSIEFGSYLSLPIVCAGLGLYLLGRRIFPVLLFPLAFLIFMLPLPNVIIIAISFKMKMLAAQAASWVVNMMGIPITRDGSTIYLPAGSLVVGDPCSGLKSLISLLALGVVFTQFTNASALKKNILCLMAIPIAVISNIFRIILLILAAHIYGEKAALGFFHDFTGLLVFAFAFIGLVAVVRLLKCQIIRPA